MAISRSYTDTTTRERTGKPRSRPGGPRPSRSAAAREEWFERFTAGPGRGSHMPLDTAMHWEWRNPLNIIPAVILLLIVLALIAAIV
jgi:hypothetical protein